MMVLERIERGLEVGFYALDESERGDWLVGNDLRDAQAALEELVGKINDVLNYENHPSRLSLSRLRHAVNGTQNGTSVESDGDDPQNTGRKPEVERYTSVRWTARYQRD